MQFLCHIVFQFFPTNRTAANPLNTQLGKKKLLGYHHGWQSMHCALFKTSISIRTASGKFSVRSDQAELSSSILTLNI